MQNRSILAVLISTALTACGGGSDSETADNENSGNTTTPTTNSAPSLLSNSFSVSYHESLTINVSDLATDSDDDPLSLSDIQNENGLTLETTSSSFTVSPSSELVGEQTITFKVFDSTDSVTGSVSVTVTNESPVANNVSVSTNSNTAVTLTADATDLEADIASVEFSEPENGTIETIDGTTTYSPIANFVGTDEVTYTVTDEVGESATATISIDVLNQAPFAQNTSTETDSNSELKIDLTGLYSDPENQDLTLEVGTAEHGTVTLNESIITYAPPLNYVGSDSVEYTVTDTHNAQSTGTISIKVNNQAPVAAQDEYRTVINTSVNLSLLSNDSDPESQKIAYVSSVTSGYGTVELTDKQLTYTPADDFFGQDSFTYTIEDIYGATATTEVIVHVGAVEFHIDDLETNDHAPGIVLNGEDTGSGGYFGSSIAIGDINNDGFNDLVTSRPTTKVNDWTEAGKVFLIYGSDSYESKEITVDTLTAEQGFTILSPAEKTSFGSYTNFVDLNDDGFLDLLFGSRAYDDGTKNQGAAFVIYGQSTFSNATYEMATPTSLDFDYTIFTATDEHTSKFGRFTKNVGDIDNDGISDVIVTKGDTSLRDHYAHLIFGSSSISESTSKDVLNDVKIFNDLYDSSYLKPHAVGDLNGDGIDDFALTAFDAGVTLNFASVYVFYGKTDWSGTYQLSSADIIFSSDVLDGHLGQEIKVLSDINGDNLPELLISEHMYEEGDINGRVHLVYGNNSFPGTVNLNTYLSDSTKGFIITGTETLNENPGFTLATGGDFNGDEIEDFIIDVPDAGKLVVIYGGQDFSSGIDLDTFALDNNADGTKSLIIKGLNHRNYSSPVTKEGQNGLAFGDYNNDGIDDIAVANPADEKVYVFFGSPKWQGNSESN